MSAVRWDSLHRATQASINLQPSNPGPRARVWECGCQMHADGKRLWLCAYHDGFDAGAEAAERHERGERVVVFVAMAVVYAAVLLLTWAWV